MVESRTQKSGFYATQEQNKNKRVLVLN